MGWIKHSDQPSNIGPRLPRLSREEVMDAVRGVAKRHPADVIITPHPGVVALLREAGLTALALDPSEVEAGDVQGRCVWCSRGSVSLYHASYTICVVEIRLRRPKYWETQIFTTADEAAARFTGVSGYWVEDLLV